MIEIKTVSLIQMILIYILYLIIVAFFYSLLFFLKGSHFMDNFFVIIIIPLLSLFIFFFTKKWCTKLCIIRLSKEKVVFEFKNKKVNECEIKLNKIDKYLFQKDQYFNVFKIYQKNNKSIKLYMFNSDLENEQKFLNFYSRFEQKINEFNENSENLLIQKKPTFYESKTAYYSAIIVLICMTLLPIFYLFSNDKIKIGNLITIYSFGLYYIYRVYLENKNK